MNRINSRFNSLKRDPISTITVKLSALKETMKRVEKRKGKNQKDGEGKGEKRVEKKREE